MARRPVGRPRKSTIGTNPLDAVIPRSQEAEERPPVNRMSFIIPPELQERVRNCVYWTPGLTVAGLATQALSDALDKLERKNGGPFAQRKSNLVGGRPIK
jgi:hypothetical protein